MLSSKCCFSLNITCKVHKEHLTCFSFSNFINFSRYFDLVDSNHKLWDGKNIRHIISVDSNKQIHYIRSSLHKTSKISEEPPHFHDGYIIGPKIRGVVEQNAAICISVSLCHLRKLGTYNMCDVFPSSLCGRM